MTDSGEMASEGETKFFTACMEHIEIICSGKARQTKGCSKSCTCMGRDASSSKSQDHQTATLV